jgi:predicted TIM-barrel fold metal-dependent hydrolase
MARRVRALLGARENNVGKSVRRATLKVGAAILALGAAGIVLAPVANSTATRVLRASQVRPAAAADAAQAAPLSTAPIAALTPYIDTHTHSDVESLADPAAMSAVIAALGQENAARILVFPAPFAANDPATYDADAFVAASKAHPDKISFLAGGGSLNPMLQESLRSRDDPDDALVRRFTATAEKILAEGAVGFGEMTAEHFAFTPAQSYESAPPDHPLFLLLADIAARHGVPIDFHMEAVPFRIPPTGGLISPPNPLVLEANIADFERLLDHNRNAKIVWAHAGWDNTGYRTADLCRRLLKAHRNLYMSIKIDPLAMGKTPLVEGAPGGKIAPEWLKLFEDFPDRFVIGSDQHYGADTDLAKGPQRWQAAVLLLNQLPENLRRKMAMENAVRIYPLSAKK